jgi:hypothetical protein
VEKSVLAEGFESVEIDVLQHFLVKDWLVFGCYALKEVTREDLMDELT